MYPCTRWCVYRMWQTEEQKVTFINDTQTARQCIRVKVALLILSPPVVWSLFYCIATFHPWQSDTLSLAVSLATVLTFCLSLTCLSLSAQDDYIEGCFKKKKKKKKKKKAAAEMLVYQQWGKPPDHFFKAALIDTFYKQWIKWWWCVVSKWCLAVINPQRIITQLCYTVLVHSLS